MRNLTRACYLDFNGVLVEPVRFKRLEELREAKGARAVLRLKESFLLPVVTRQSGIEKGRFIDREFAGFFSGFSKRAFDGTLLGPYVCAHSPKTQCGCQKSELMRRAAEELSIDLSKSYIIGDEANDIRNGKKAGLRGCCLLMTDFFRKNRFPSLKAISPDFIADTLDQAVDWILRDSREAP